jgi:hypothetical protein
MIRTYPACVSYVDWNGEASVFLAVKICIQIIIIKKGNCYNLYLIEIS